MSWTLYIIETDSGKLYTGITTDLEKRFLAHAKGKGASFFRISSPKKIRYTERFESRSLALKRECELKKLSRQQKLALIEKNQ